jgi:hypothetical protein
MYILIGLTLDFSFFNTAFMSDLLMSAKCNALAARNAISVAMPTNSISNSFLFLIFSITSLHSVAAEPAVFAKIRRLSRSEPRLAGDSTKNMSKFGLNLAQFGPMFLAASHDVETSAGRYVSRAGKA